MLAFLQAGLAPSDLGRLRGFVGSLAAMAGGLQVVLLGTVVALPSGMGKARSKVKFTTLLSKRPAVNWLSAARLFLFSARDVWFVVGLPVFLASTLSWTFMQVRAFVPACPQASGIPGHALTRARSTENFGHGCLDHALDEGVLHRFAESDVVFGGFKPSTHRLQAG